MSSYQEMTDKAWEREFAGMTDNQMKDVCDICLEKREGALIFTINPDYVLADGKRPYYKKCCLDCLLRKVISRTDGETVGQYLDRAGRKQFDTVYPLYLRLIELGHHDPLAVPLKEVKGTIRALEAEKEVGGGQGWDLVARDDQSRNYPKVSKK